MTYSQLWASKSTGGFYHAVFIPRYNVLSTNKCVDKLPWILSQCVAGRVNTLCKMLVTHLTCLHLNIHFKMIATATVNTPLAIATIPPYPTSTQAHPHLPTNTLYCQNDFYLILFHYAWPIQTYCKHQHACAIKHRWSTHTLSHTYMHSCINTVVIHGHMHIHTYILNNFTLCTYVCTWRHILEVKTQSTVHHVR